MGGGFCAGGGESLGWLGLCVAYGAVPDVLPGHGTIRSCAAISGLKRNGLGELDGGNSPPRGQGIATAWYVSATEIFSERRVVKHARPSTGSFGFRGRRAQGAGAEEF